MPRLFPDVIFSRRALAKTQTARLVAYGLNKQRPLVGASKRANELQLVWQLDAAPGRGSNVVPMISIKRRRRRSPRAVLSRLLMTFARRSLREITDTWHAVR